MDLEPAILDAAPVGEIPARHRGKRRGRLRTNSRRDPLFNQLDARVEKEWKLGPVKLATYLDVQNVYAAENPEGYRYSFDYSKREAVSGLALFPNLGLRGEL